MAADLIGKEVNVLQAGIGAAINIAADNRVALERTAAVRVVVNGIGATGTRAADGGCGNFPFAQTPPVVDAACRMYGLKVNFLSRALTDVRNPLITRIAIEAATVRIS